VSRPTRLGLAHAVGAATGAAVVAWFGPPGADLAAHVYQRAVFLEHGFSVWNNLWYAGRYSYVTYSLVYYPLAAVVGIKVLAVASAALAAAAFAVLVDREWPGAGAWPARTFTVVSAAAVLTGAFPYALGLAVALLALDALAAGRRRLFGLLVAVTFAASPLAFLLLAVVLTGAALARRTRVRGPVVAVAATGAVGVALWRAFPGEGQFPFPRGELAASLTFCALGLAFTWRVATARLLRFVFAAYAVACVASFLVPSQLGENVARLRFVAVPLAVLALSLRGWKPLAPALGALALAVSWNFTPLAFSFARASRDPSASAAYWRPVVRFLHRSLTPDHRVEVVGTAGHWEAVYLARAGIPIARGWYRQDDFPENRVLYHELTRATYAHWLRRMGVAYVVLTDAPVDYGAGEERELLVSGRSGLVRVASAPHVTIFTVPRPAGIVSGPPGARVLAMGRTSATLALPRPGRYRVALRYAPYWSTDDAACVARRADGMIELTARRAGRVRLAFEVTAPRALSVVVGAKRNCK
jgi:hypothetical protein